MLESLMRKKIVGRWGTRHAITPIETPSTVKGVPDLFLQAVGVSWWIELKNIKRHSSPIPWRVGQLSWIERHTNDRHQGMFALVLSVDIEIFIITRRDCIKKRYSSFRELYHASTSVGTFKELPEDLWVLSAHDPTYCARMDANVPVDI